MQYLQNAASLHASYCISPSSSSLTCFYSKTADSDYRTDDMCLGSNAYFDASTKSFRLDCPLRQLSPEEEFRGLPNLPDGFNDYWYETGIYNIISVDQSVWLNSTRSSSRLTSRPTQFSILFKREGTSNPWHSFLELMSMLWSLDILQMTTNPRTNLPYLPTRHRQNAQLVILDNLDDGPYFELLQLFTHLPIRRLNELDASDSTTDIILPFAGGSNPIWQGDWIDIPCKTAPLLQLFVNRVFNLYDFPISNQEKGDKVVVTFIDRGNTRRLLNQTDHLEFLSASVSDIQLNVVRFESLPIRDQIDIIRHTDILVGVHGAGLTHSMFLRQNSAVVEILPQDFNYKGFRNLAQLARLQYFPIRAQRTIDSSNDDQSWQMEPVQIPQHQLVNIIQTATHAIH